MTAVTMEPQLAAVLAGIRSAATRRLLTTAVGTALEDQRRAEAEEAARAARLRIERQAMYAQTFRVWLKLLPADLAPYAVQDPAGELALARSPNEAHLVEIVFPELEPHLRARVQCQATAGKSGEWWFDTFLLPSVAKVRGLDGVQRAELTWDDWARCDNPTWAIAGIVKLQVDLLTAREECAAFNGSAEVRS